MWNAGVWRHNESQNKGGWVLRAANKSQRKPCQGVERAKKHLAQEDT